MANTTSFTSSAPQGVFETPVARTMLLSASDASTIAAAITHRIEELRMERCGAKARRQDITAIDNQLEQLAAFAMTFDRFADEIVVDLITQTEMEAKSGR